MKNSSYSDIPDTLPHSMHQLSPLDKTPSLIDAVDYINKMDFSLIENKLRITEPLVSHRWTRQELDIGIQYYRNFLYLNKKY